jgi:hypothetical protein
MFEKILQLLAVKCAHRRLSQPFSTATHSSTAHVQGTSALSWENMPAAGHYVVCLECGQKFPYDWEKMRIVR